MEWRSLTFVVFSGLLSMAISGCGRVETCPELPEAAAVTAAAAPYVGAGDPYSPGPLTVRRIELDECAAANPRPLLIFAPDKPGSYPVVVFQHGFLARNTDYSEILRHLAGHGFVVVAPQMYEPRLIALFGRPTVMQEARGAAEVVHWLPGGLVTVLGYTPDASRVGLAGHSRGGEVVWLVLNADPAAALAVAGIDPVDGSGLLEKQTRVVHGTFGFSLPALVIGTGLGGVCAPAGDNHEQFYAACRAPAWHVVVPHQGHADMLDEMPARTAGYICPGGPDREEMRQLTAGLLVALFRASLQGDGSAYAYLMDPARMPLEVEVEWSLGGR